MANPSDFSCILVTGGAGFIGSALVRQLGRETDATVVNVDALTYAANPDSLQDALHHPRHHLEVVDIRDQPALRAVFHRYRPQAVVHLAAESHVDRSIAGPAAFIQTNIVGTSTLLEVTREYWQRLDRAGRERFRFHHVSTDEVFGSLGAQGAFDETSPYRPNSPYAASKAASDHLVRAWQYVKDHARALLEAASFVDAAQLRALAEPLRKNGYGDNLLQILQEPLL